MRVTKKLIWNENSRIGPKGGEIVNSKFDRNCSNSPIIKSLSILNPALYML